jgi:transposase
VELLGEVLTRLVGVEAIPVGDPELAAVVAAEDACAARLLPSEHSTATCANLGDGGAHEGDVASIGSPNASSPPMCR